MCVLWVRDMSVNVTLSEVSAAVRVLLLCHPGCFHLNMHLHVYSVPTYHFPTVYANKHGH